MQVNVLIPISCRSTRIGHEPDHLTAARTNPEREDNPAFALVIGLVEPPAGIEPATPSLPSMRAWFTTPRTTSRAHTTGQVKGPAEGCAVGG
jgi:hypothetical protein